MQLGTKTLIEKERGARLEEEKRFSGKWVDREGKLGDQN